ncbi:unnamed protein product [Linum tenue]|uniref:Uncharacterized protein n=1 Tax=Linum tenue TaxID=586396 RepID=A0AAV0RDN1_9ROSI|nr:unnamed protein product [Linum tenue]
MRRKLVFSGWGSKDLLEFLASIGKETAEQLSQQEVVGIISKYCADNSLFDPEKRKRILCDAKLQTLFRRKWISKNGIHTHVGKHFAENQSDDHGDDDDAMEVDEQVDQGLEVGEGSGENYVASSGEKRKRKSRPKAGCQKLGKEVMVVRKGLFASVTAENIKRVYLRKNVLDELMKETESFDAKVVGCFVRIKTDPYDYSRTTSHLLVLVKGSSPIFIAVVGVKRTPGNAEMGDSVLLEVSCVLKDVPISKVSDDNFTEDECEDLRQRVKDGLLKRPLIADFEEKAQSLHEAITRDVCTLSSLFKNYVICVKFCKPLTSSLPTLAEYWETWNNLQTPEEQSRLLQKFPEIDADEEAAESACKEIPRHEEQATFLQPGEVLIKAKPSKCLIREGTSSPRNVVEATGNAIKAAQTSPPARTASLSPDNNVVDKIREEGIQKVVVNTQKHIFLPPDNMEKTRQEDLRKKAAKTTEKETPAAVPFPMEKSIEKDAPKVASNTDEQTGKEPSQKTEKCATGKIEIIDLSDDDNTRPAAINNQAAATENVNAKMWHCMSVRQGLRLGGLYPISLLRKWRDSSSNPSALHFKVWKEGQREEEAILLEEAIRRAYGLK